MNTQTILARQLTTRYDVVCHRPKPEYLLQVRQLRALGQSVPSEMLDLIWTDFIFNLVVNAGLDDSLDKHLKGSGYTAAWYIGLTDGTPSFAAGDQESGHAGWVEVTAYDEAARQTLVLGAVSGQSVDNTASKAVFTISSDDTTIGGAFLSTASVKGATVDTLYGGGAFTAGDKTIDDDDTLTLTITCTASAS